MQTPTIGRIVHYKLSEQDAASITRARNLTVAAKLDDGRTSENGTAAKLATGNQVKAGDVFPMIITRVWSFWAETPGSAVQGQVFLDGNDVHWATSVSHGDAEGQYVWPPRV